METKLISFDKKSKCSHCGSEIQFKLHPVFNLQDLNEDEFKQLFDLDVFKVKCKNCNKTTVVQYDTIIVDMYKKYIIYLYTSDKIENFNASTSEVIDKMFKSTTNSALAFKDIKHFRIATNLNDMLEKMLIFDYDLDDRIIECIKYQAIKTYISNNSSFSNTEYKLFFNKIERTDLLFTAIPEDKSISPVILSAPMECYNFFIDNTNVKSLSNSDFVLIDQEWMLKNIKIEVEMKNV